MSVPACTSQTASSKISFKGIYDSFQPLIFKWYQAIMCCKSCKNNG
ncbi:hypothetical protein HMPREF0201_00165 [Cedecea davisae DSM 4568]|uniref:Uncharacterized protein n=1 Tax=Cedecea davisae DSM 4568 TaxID=566551 RepID=S3K5U1_9ENTR|nr:hypothetical protein HMPREF0201_00165 [Cedecea davisae DSM 4568]